MHQCLKLILFWSNSLHVSDGVSVHHRELKTVHTATGICQTDTADCLICQTDNADCLICQTDSADCLICQTDTALCLICQTDTADCLLAC